MDTQVTNWLHDPVGQHASGNNVTVVCPIANTYDKVNYENRWWCKFANTTWIPHDFFPSYAFSQILSLLRLLQHHSFCTIPPSPLFVQTLSHSVNTPDFLSPVSFDVCHVPSLTSFLSVSRFQQSLSPPFFMSCYIVSVSALRFSLPNFLLFAQHFTCPSLSVIGVILYLSLVFFLDRHILRLSPIFLVNSFLCLLRLPLVYLYLCLLHDNSSINKRPFVKSTCPWDIKTLSKLMRQECIRRPGHANKL